MKMKNIRGSASTLDDSYKDSDSEVKCLVITD